MVGVQSYREVTAEQIEWLKNGGRNRIERMAKRFMKIWSGAGDFYVRITLPTDIATCAATKDSPLTKVWIFDHYRRKQAEGFFETLKKGAKEGDEVRITTMKEEMGLRDNEIMVDVTWHGDRAFQEGWEYCETVIPDGMFPPQDTPRGGG